MKTQLTPRQEWVGAHQGEVETNYYHNDPTDHTNARTIALSFNPEASSHTYTLDVCLSSFKRTN